MRSVRKQLKAAVLAALASACTPPQGRHDAGGGTDSGPTPGSGSTGQSPTNLCTDCVAQGMECNLYATGCQPPCTDCACTVIVEPVAALDGGYPDGGLPLPLCRAACPDPIGNVWSCGVVDGGCNPAELGAICVRCLAEGCSGVGGRCPEGLRPPAIAPSNPLAAFLARSAHMEAASVYAFHRMVRELRRFQAPRALVHRAQRAARDEARHARAMGRLALRNGGVLARVEIPAFGDRDLEAFAIENAVEGTVRETLGAALALVQSRKAHDPDLRRAMRDISEDEADHAELAWAIDSWAQGRLGDSARERVRSARARQASKGGEVHFAPEIVRAAGLPSAPEARSLWIELRERFWTEVPLSPSPPMLWR